MTDRTEDYLRQGRLLELAKQLGNGSQACKMMGYSRDSFYRFIAAIYAIEKTIRERSADERREVRQEKSKPLVLELKAWFAQQLARVSGKSPVADAIRYAQHHWDGLTRFLDDGRIELDTNVVERNIRPSC